MFVCVLRPIDSEVNFLEGTPIYCPLQRTRSSVNTPFQPGIEPRVVAWQSITLPLCHASSLFNYVAVLTFCFLVIHF